MSPGYTSEHIDTILQDNNMSDITYLPTSLDVPVSRVLDSENAQNCDRVMVIGWLDDEFYFASSTGDSKDLNWLLDLAKIAVLEVSV